ncbi:hypothetical protein SAMN05421872_102317 [Nocardioides lianchengensis]|uniref:Uncharacterized protein n=1 Tax=Nocardioides lianchengensis TaxID=1045774 RepID=A0A1G6LPN8_9ACTN|nr:hypothetical protein [Nocardioides lianchengensis]SDC45047.1 hypothetical protein SAMN05421872_102317 [Nocardioides lianchengensis]
MIRPLFADSAGDLTVLTAVILIVVLVIWATT